MNTRAWPAWFTRRSVKAGRMEAEYTEQTTLPGAVRFRCTMAVVSCASTACSAMRGPSGESHCTPVREEAKT